ncbi:GAF domain-containing protein [Deinococcus sp. AJ005]|uniref:ATP-binding protein n=1 Tax=Deinococcus sp. AJ005 TaxID=2652443 RepID=UPI00125CCF15|nr:GAF domain-containing protein [Deinococcus sp. AJ005]QFP77453.1 GAF domain-containing protein [Deinococcus sp. AJ005]
MPAPHASSADLQLLSQALATSVHSVVIADARQPDQPIIYVNPAFERMSGYPASQILGRNCRFLQGQDWDQGARHELRQAIQEGRSTTVLLRNYRLDGTLFFNELTISPLHDLAGNVTHFLGFQTDVTAREAAAVLMAALQNLTENLAAVRTQQEVTGLVLRDALSALRAISGVVLLVQDGQLHVVARNGYDDASIWQDGDLEGHRPSPDALRRDTPLFFQESGELAAAYPELEARTGGMAPVASAVLPMVQDGQPLGVIILNFREPHRFTLDEEHFLRTLAGQCALALDRARLSGDLERQVRDRTAELEAFVNFTEVVDSETNVLALAGRAVDVLSVLFPDCTNGYYALENGLWKLKVHTSDLEDDPSLLGALRAGMPLDTPAFAQPMQTGQPIFVDGWDPQKERFAGTEIYQSVAFYPLSIGGRPQAMFALGFKDTMSWSEHYKAVFRAVGRSLGLALERTETARQLMVQRDQLQATNEELEAFTYSVSHDLRTPVRHIISFGDLLRRELPEPLNAKAERYFGIVSSAAITLSGLIDGMLDVSRTSRQPLRREGVNLERLFTAVRHEMGVAQPQRQIEWRISDLPTVMGDADLLRQVITALMNNAVKYTRTREQALIEIWAEDQGPSWVVRVRDNGVGFNPQYSDKLFTMFQRLHRQEDFEGAAVSLANARRIMTRHGGTMMAEGQPGVGSTFGFILPKVPD